MWTLLRTGIKCAFVTVLTGIAVSIDRNLPPETPSHYVSSWNLRLSSAAFTKAPLHQNCVRDVGAATHCQKIGALSSCRLELSCGPNTSNAVSRNSTALGFELEACSVTCDYQLVRFRRCLTKAPLYQIVRAMWKLLRTAENWPLVKLQAGIALRSY